MIDFEAHGLVPPPTPPRDRGGPPTIGELVGSLVAAGPEELALVGRHGRLTAAELEAATNRAAHAFRSLGIKPGDRVAASLPNDIAIVIAFLGAMKTGAIWVGINRALAPPEKAYMLRDSQAKVVLGTREIVDEITAEPDLPDLAAPVVVAPAEAADEWDQLLQGEADRPLDTQVSPLDPAAIAYTSGTTGFPKGAVHSQHNLLLAGAMTPVGDRPGDGVLGVALPLTVLNLIVLGPLRAYQHGARLVTMDRIDAVGMAEWISRERITTFSAVPAMVHDLLTHPEVSDDMLASLEVIGVGGADMPDAFRRLYEQRFGRRVGTGYGLTEAPTVVTMEDPEEPAVPGSCGKSMPQVEIHVLGDHDQPLPPGEVGEVCVGPATAGEHADVYRPMLGYWNRPEESATALRGGLLHTGDIGVLDADGNLFIKDRKNDLIIRGGANVYPAEVERVLHDDPTVAACAVIGRPDARLGERVVAYVQLIDGAPPDPDGLRSLCRRELARYKVPDSITFVEQFDRTPMGKIRKNALRELDAEPVSTSAP